MIVLRKINTETGIARAVPLVGVQDNSNKVYNTPSDYILGTISIDYNGQTLSPNVDFLQSGVNEITFIWIAPHSDDILRATYDKVR